MPIYEYECTSCKFCFDLRHGFNEEPTVLCPHCQEKTHRVIRPLPVIFKGSGFYVTDNRKASPTVTPAEPLKDSKDSGEKKVEPVKATAESKTEPVKATVEKKAEPVAKKE
ncbi:MAG: putative regulatory protein, FmdB family [Dehalococcoidia bacterium]|nr:putative regulatory protein, FmdB family [Dehalococcoidia bacterium]